MAIRLVVKNMLDRLRTSYQHQECFQITHYKNEHKIRIGELHIKIVDDTVSNLTKVDISTVIPSQFNQSYVADTTLAAIRMLQVTRFIREWADAYLAYKVTERGKVLDQFLWACSEIDALQLTCVDREMRRIGYKNFYDFIDTVGGLAEKKRVSVNDIILSDTPSTLVVSVLSDYRFGFKEWYQLRETFQKLIAKPSKFYLIPTHSRVFVLEFNISLGK